MSIYDSYREPMGTSAYTLAGNRSGQPGGSNAPRTLYRSAGPRVPPDHVLAAHRRQKLIDATSGQVMYDTAEDRLRHEAANAATQKRRASHSAVNAAIANGPGKAGYLGGQVVLRGPEAQLLRIFGMQR
jgi:hypothetical protein